MVAITSKWSDDQLHLIKWSVASTNGHLCTYSRFRALNLKIFSRIHDVNTLNCKLSSLIHGEPKKHEVFLGEDNEYLCIKYINTHQHPTLTSRQKLILYMKKQSWTTFLAVLLYAKKTQAFSHFYCRNSKV